MHNAVVNFCCFLDGVERVRGRGGGREMMKLTYCIVLPAFSFLSFHLCFVEREYHDEYRALSSLVLGCLALSCLGSFSFLASSPASLPPRLSIACCVTD